VKRFVAIVLFAAGGILGEHAATYAYKVFWVRGIPVDANRFFDGLGRPLEDAPNAIVSLISRQNQWAGLGWFAIDTSKCLLSLLVIYALVRIGIRVYDRKM
jgi:hypothetical protein